MRRLTVLACSAVLIIAGDVRALIAQIPRVTDAQVAGIKDAQIRAGIRALADSAVISGISAEAILDLGRQSNLYPDKRAGVLPEARRLLDWLRESRRSLGPDATQEDIKSGAAALKAGVDPQTLRMFAAEKHNAELFVSFSVLADLVSSKVPVDTAVSVVTRLLASGIRNNGLASYRDMVRTDIALGAIPSVAATTRAEAPVINNAGNFDFGQSGVGARATSRQKIPPE